MNAAVAFILGIPLAVELIGACFSVRDSWWHREAREAAVERLAVPMLFWGVLWWMCGIEAGTTLLTALALVALWQVIAFYSIRLLSRWSGFQTKAIDTDAEFGAETLEKKSPGDNGDWGGERKSPGP